jgi:hypothetical protein
MERIVTRSIVCAVYSTMGLARGDTSDFSLAWFRYTGGGNLSSKN